jgi:hypothetical protein
VNPRALPVEMRQLAFDLGVHDAEARAAWQYSLEDRLRGKGFTLEQKAVLLTEYGRGWRAAGCRAQAGRLLPDRGAISP